MAKPVIVCVDDEKIVLTSLKQELEYGLGDRFNFEIAESGEEGLEVIDEFLDMGMDIPVVISDQLMPGMKGDQFLTQVNHKKADIRKILLTGQASADAVGNAVNQANLYRYIAKPWDENDLRLTVDEAAKSYLTNQILEVKIKILEDLNKYAKLLSKDVKPDSMIKSFLDHTLVDLQAARGAVLFLPESEDGLCIQGNFDGGGVASRLLDGGLADAGLPLDVINHVRNTRDSLVLNNAFRSGQFTSDPYISGHKTRSVFCAPIQVENNLLAILYLEQGSTIRYFEQERLEFLNLLLGQASTAFDNSLLYHTLEQKIEARTATIQEMNHELTNSITYASRIQGAILPEQERIKERLPESFIFYVPKDIVSGDFYWYDSVEGGRSVIAAVDCTGHGVPGAFMTVIGYTQLNHIVTEAAIHEPGEILNHLDKRVRKALNQDRESVNSQDGMDMSLCVVDREAGTVGFAGAMNPLFLVRNGELEIFAANKFPIGGSQYEEKQFVTTTIDVQAGDRLYLFSDGFIDQFGGNGTRSKRFGTKRFKQLLLSIQDQDMETQGETLKSTYFTYKGEEEQLDDVLVIGFEI